MPIIQIQKIDLIIAAVAFSFLLIGIRAHNAYGQAMSSSNFKIESDSVNVGGIRSGSATYSLEDTVGEQATGVSTSTNYVMNAGYQRMQSSVISITDASDVVMSPAIAGVTGGVSDGSTSFYVTTDNSAGYTVTIVASTSPALVSAADSFADYVPAGANPDYSFLYTASQSVFGFSPEGEDIDSRFKNNGASCGTGSNISGACWDGLSTTPQTVVTRNSPNHPSGIETTIRFRAAVGSTRVQPNGLYVATTTITALPL